MMGIVGIALDNDGSNDDPVDDKEPEISASSSTGDQSGQINPFPNNDKAKDNDNDNDNDNGNDKDKEIEAVSDGGYTATTKKRKRRPKTTSNKKKSRVSDDEDVGDDHDGDWFGVPRTTRNQARLVGMSMREHATRQVRATRVKHARSTMLTNSTGNVTLKQQPVVEFASSKGENGSANCEIDLTLSDEDESGMQEVEISDAKDANVTSMFVIGEIVKTIFGYGSIQEVRDDGSYGVMLFWDGSSWYNKHKRPNYSMPSFRVFGALRKEMLSKADESFVARLELHDRQFGAYGPKNNVIQLTGSDVSRCNPGFFLNDTIIDFWIGKTLKAIPQEQFERVYIFNSLFFGWARSIMLSRSASDRTWYQSVKSTTKSVDIFEKDLLFMPINDAQHWSLIVICRPGLIADVVNAQTKPSENKKATDDEQEHDHGNDDEKPPQDTGGKRRRKSRASSKKRQKKKEKEEEEKKQVPVKTPWVLYFDSSPCPQRTRNVLTMLRAYFEMEWNNRKRDELGPLNGPIKASTLPTVRLNVPKQENHCDCGVFMLEYLERILREHIDQMLDIFEHQQELGPSQVRTQFNKHFRPDWFSQKDIAMKRHHMDSLFRLFNNLVEVIQPS